MRIVFGIMLLCYGVTAQAEAPQRIVSVGGALTEIIYALGAESALVGSDTTSYYPAAAAQLPKVGYERALSAEGILSLNPDLVIVTEEAGPPPVLRQLAAAGVALLTLKASRSLADVEEAVLLLGQKLNRQEAATQVIDEMRQESQQLAAMTAQPFARKKVMFIMNHGGGAPMVAGANTAADSIIRLSGGRNVVQDFTGYKPLTSEAAVSLQPDVILITRRGLARMGGKEDLLKMPGIALTPAARDERVIAMDSLLMLGFGPRTAKAARALHQSY